MHIEARTYKYLREKMTGEKCHILLYLRYFHNIEVAGAIMIEMTWGNCYRK